MKVVFLPVSMIEKPKSGICVYFSKISFFFKGWGRGKKKAHNIHYQAPRYCLAVILSITILPSLHFFFVHAPGFVFGHFRDREEKLRGNPGKDVLFLLKKVEVKGECPP